MCNIISDAGIEGRENLAGVVYSHTVSLLEEENAILRKAMTGLKDDLDRLKRSPLMVCEVVSPMGGSAIIKMPNGNKFLVDVLSDCGKIRPGDMVFVEQKNMAVVKKASVSKRLNGERFITIEKPNVQWEDVGGLDKQIKEMREIVELPLAKPELFRKIGIQPPKGVLLHGQPGTGKTLLAKAVATATNATFIEVVGSELVQKFIGEGAKLVKEIFRTAREKAPSILFIDELDALAARRVDAGTSGEREVQRTFVQLLSEIDGFKGLENVKVIGCTNRKDMLDPAILRPGRLERHIGFPVPGKEARKEIMRIHASKMSLGEVDLPCIVEITEGFTGAELKSVCTEAGYFAIRDERITIETGDFISAVEKLKNREEAEGREYAAMFG